MPGENNTANFCIYMAIGDFASVRSTLTNLFSKVTNSITVKRDDPQSGSEIVVLHLQDDSALTLTINYSPAFMREHVAGMEGYYRQIPCENQELLENVCRQIQVFNCVASCSFELTPSQERTDFIINNLFAAAKGLAGVLFFPSAALYNAEGKKILATDGTSDLESYVPIGHASLLDKQREESPSDRERREHNQNVLREKGIPFLPNLKVFVSEEEAVFRSPEEIALRLLPMFGVCVYCEAMSSQTREESLKYLKGVDTILGGRLRELMTPQEQAFTDDEEPEQREVIRYSWRYECCYVLLWALGYIRELGDPAAPCNVSEMAKLLWSLKNPEELLKGAHPRSGKELLDAHDLILRYDWACVDARVKGQGAPAGLDGGVTVEWHYALNWLVGDNGHADWDDISPNT